MSDLELLSMWWDAKPDNVKKNGVVVGKGDILGQTLVHISTNPNIKSFVPCIGDRQAPMEDRTIPRVCTANTVLGAMLGANLLENDHNRSQKEYPSYLGGYAIYVFRPEAAIAPNDKLCGDSKLSGEHWLVPYSESTQAYPAQIGGKIFIGEFRGQPRSQKDPKIICDFYVEVTDEKGFYFSKNKLLLQGFWKITGDLPVWGKQWERDARYVVEPVLQSTYVEIKKRSAALLSVDRELKYAKW